MSPFCRGTIFGGQHPHIMNTIENTCRHVASLPYHFGGRSSCVCVGQGDEGLTQSNGELLCKLCKCHSKARRAQRAGRLACCSLATVVESMRMIFLVFSQVHLEALHLLFVHAVFGRATVPTSCPSTLLVLFPNRATYVHNIFLD